MGALVDALQPAVFDAGIVLTLWDRAESVAVWHAIVNEDGRRLEYFDRRVQRSRQTLSVDPTDIPAIRNSRHILGWTPGASYTIGMSPVYILLDHGTARIIQSISSG